MKKLYMQPELQASHIEIPHTIDVSGGSDFWGDDYIRSDVYGDTVD